MTWTISPEQPLAIRLTELETYLSGVQLPLVAEGNIRTLEVPSAFLFADVSFFVVDLLIKETALEAFPLLVFRGKEPYPPIVGDMKEIRLYGLSGGSAVSVNSYIKGTVTILPS